MICSIDISLQMIVFFLLFVFLVGTLSFCRAVTLWFIAEKQKYGSVLNILSVLSAVIIRKSAAACPFIFNFDIFYCLLYTLSLFTTNLDIDS